MPEPMHVHMRVIKDRFLKNWASKPEKKLLSIVKRLSDEGRWNRTIRKILNTQVETVLRDLGYVKNKPPHTSQIFV
jgi:hypothetical protein